MEIRQAKPEDAASAVTLVHSSGPEAFDYVFSVDYPGQSLDFLRYAFVREFGAFSYRMHSVVLMDERVVATMVTYSDKQFLRLNAGNIRAIVGFYFSTSGLISACKALIRGLSIETLIKPPRKGRYYLGNLGVEPGLQGKGIGSQLIGRAVELAKEKGLHWLSLDVATTNPEAEKLYTRLGFKCVEARKFRFNRSGLPEVPDTRYMERELV